MLVLRKQNQVPAIPIKKQKTELYSTESEKKNDTTATWHLRYSKNIIFFTIMTDFRVWMKHNFLRQYKLTKLIQNIENLNITIIKLKKKGG